MTTLTAAVQALDARKLVALGNEESPADVSSVDVAGKEARLMVVGFDLDLHEMRRLSTVVGLYAAAHDLNVADAAAAAWLDGVLSGLMLAELRGQDAGD